MGASRKCQTSENNRLLWTLKAAWLAGDSVDQQLMIHALVADWLEDQGREKECTALRSGEWGLWWSAKDERYFILGRHDRPPQRNAWSIHWWPLRSYNEYWPRRRE